MKIIDKYRVLIIGSGAAGYSAADWLYRFGINDIAILTENITGGTSRNAGSDKQTYYKLSLTGSDSVEEMAQTIFGAGAADGDIALIEAADSVRCFMRLVEYGVPFPTDKYGRYVGYQTDHDNTLRATSAGPLTSKYMTECLENKVKQQETDILDSVQAVKIIVDNGRATGVLAVCGEEKEEYLCAFHAEAVILATGGQGSAYYDTVYPVSQTGSMGLAVRAGCRMCNLTEWQYGIASKNPKWNLSGSYQQVIPRYYSLSSDGQEHDFLYAARHRFKNGSVYDMIFLKGYQWPFDSQKCEGSSLIDLLVMQEKEKGRHIFLDYRQNMQGYDLDKCSEETNAYLRQAGAIDDTPYQRLKKLNADAIDLFLSFGVDLSVEPLEIIVAAQHINGGIRVDTNWQSSVKGLFAVGEAAGTLGVYRPGGTALNSTQVGGLRIAQYLCGKEKTHSQDKEKLKNALAQENEWLDGFTGNEENFEERLTYFQKQMTRSAGILRDYDLILKLERELNEEAEHLSQRYRINKNCMKALYKYSDAVTFQLALCRTLLKSVDLIGSRGGAIMLRNGISCPQINENFSKILITEQNKVFVEEPKKIPADKDRFEKIWRESR